MESYVMEKLEMLVYFMKKVIVKNVFVYTGQELEKEHMIIYVLEKFKLLNVIFAIKESLKIQLVVLISIILIHPIKFVAFLNIYIKENHPNILRMRFQNADCYVVNVML